LVYVKNASNLKILTICINVIFNKISSGNNEVDKFIKKAQLKAKDYKEVLEWVNMIDLKMLNIWPKEDLELFIKQFGKMDG
jgi:hypothetical protein